MRMWGVSPKFMCREHLMGEHLEIHMFLGTIRKKISIHGYVKNNLVEPRSLILRHEELVREIKRRGYTHKSPVEDPDLSYLPEDIANAKLDKPRAAIELFRRCTKCLERREKYDQVDR